MVAREKIVGVSVIDGKHKVVKERKEDYILAKELLEAMGYKVSLKEWHPEAYE